MKRLVRGEKGYVLIAALLVLVVLGLISGPLLSYMVSGLRAGHVFETGAAELYAADAGVEDAMWKIQHARDAGLPGCGNQWIYTYPEPGEPVFEVNGKSVVVTIQHLGAGAYNITSIAITLDGSDTAAIDSTTTVEAYVSASFMDFSSLLDNAIVSNGSVTIRPGTVVGGDVWLPDSDDLENQGEIYGDVKDSDNMTMTWPTYEQLSPYYLDDVEGTPDPGPGIDVKDTQTIGACYREGSLIVDNTGDPGTLVLEGTLYVTGDLEFRQPGSGDYTIDLNQKTIFVEGSIDFPSGHVSISGSGCIIAAGDINFQPSIASEGDEFVLVLSIAGQVFFHPNGDFTGCIAGNADVQLQPGNTLDWISPEGKGLDFPMGGDGSDEFPPMAAVRIESWEVSRP